MDVIGNGFLGRGFAAHVGSHPGVTVLAAGVSVTGTVPESEYRRDASLVVDVIRRCKRQGRLLIYFSTASAHLYNVPGSGGREDDPIFPLSAYGRHKLLLETFVRQSGVRHLVLRLSHAVGPGQAEHQLLSVLTRAVVSGRVSLFRGACRDLISLTDTVRILEMLIASGIEDEVVNVASGIAVPIDDIVDHMEKRLGVVTERVYTGDHRASEVSLTKLRRIVPEVDLLGFGPTYYQGVIDSVLEPMVTS